MLLCSSTCFIPFRSKSSVESGFTLIELLMVILIIGLSVSLINLSIGQNSNRIVQDEVERLHGLIQLAREESVLQGRDLALEFDHDRYRFFESVKEVWQLVKEDPMLRERPLPEGVRLSLLVEGAETSFEDKKKLPRIYILSSGELTPFEMTLKTDEGEEYSLQGLINGKLVLTRAEADEDR